MRSKLQRAIDANLNRSREALRVCEDITRFVLDDKILTKSLKITRHKISRVADRLLEKKLLSIRHRDTAGDVGKASLFDKGRPANLKSLFYKNCHRAQESIRALEEFSKLMQGNFSREFKAIRFRVYSVEKKAIRKLQALCSD